ncbi:hypothetical protein FVE67_08390 [Thermosulfurimonas marina]|uniref:Uncharacterized protein n=1 Tax=Thermosulfurimonas marina TaxID=2047767 RepID=A0A6H1WUA8_9BACT|nr:hypothetical protein [Thermosulfurimonas marina]QJA06805.1 hypothetical protein FVE67_08390 [Thermosulfurimonas marina]
MEGSLYQEIKERLERLEREEGLNRELVIDARTRLEGLEWTILRVGAAVDRLRESLGIVRRASQEGFLALSFGGEYLEFLKAEVLPARK